MLELINIEDFDLENEIKVGFYSISSYTSIEDANSCGAIYSPTNSISLYGVSGLYDLDDIVKTINNCINGGNDIIALVKTKAGEYVELDTILKLV